MNRKYGGYISGIKNNEASTKYIIVYVDSPTKVVAKLLEECKKAFPESEGYTFHGTSQESGIRIY